MAETVLAFPTDLRPVRTYRRHVRICPLKPQGRRSDIKKCQCPVWAEGTDINGRRIQISLRTSDYELGLARAGETRLGRRAPINELAVARAIIAISEASQSEEYVYFIGTSSAVKIGISVDIRGRFETLQTGCPYPLFFRAAFQRGGRDLERKLHSIFADHHRHKEWFRYDATLQVFIERAKRLDGARRSIASAPPAARTVQVAAPRDDRKTPMVPRSVLREAMGVQV